MDRKCYRRWLAAGITALSVLCGQVVMAGTPGFPIHINSGNPKFPFPQFLEYSYGSKHSLDNLGTKNPEGVVHLEMEQDIRDAYQIFANEWEYTGDVMDGVKYIKGNIGCPYDCREGDGYSMLAAAVMADKDAFDGLWFRIHDAFRPNSKSYMTGATIGGGGYGDLIIGDQVNTCSATDGDNEVVLALYIAWRQWGDDSGHKAANGEKISYKKDLIEVVRGLVAIYDQRFPTENPRRCTTGDVGLDGYLKNGTTWAEVTNWGGSNPLSMNGVDYIPEFAGPVNMHTDYSSPAYFREFYELVLALDLPESNEWEREQYRRCEASCDWMVGNWLSQSAKNLFFGEEASVVGDKVTLDAGNQGGRFRAAWRTALNYVWHGNPDYTWNPTSHKVESGGNTFEKDWCDRFSEFMNDPQGWDPSSTCTKYGGGPDVTYKGPSTLHWDIEPDGSFPKSEFTFNWIPGVGMPAAIGAQDLDLAGLLYRQCNIEWDITEPGDGYLTSIPHYFHGFFRWLGMIVATGNHIAPGQMATPKANMKIYRAIEDSVTFAYTGDKIKYLLDYRNFGSVDAKNVQIVENVPADFIVDEASITNGGKYNKAKHTITWDIGTVDGVKSDDNAGPALDLESAGLKKTIGQVSYKCTIGPNASGRYCTTADITCSNGTGWTTNEYPNYITATMQRNCVDVIKRSLKIEKKANMEKVNPGNMVEYRINFENSSEAGWLDGGRPRVTVAAANKGLGSSQQWLYYRLYSDAIEPYINYGNYRIAYYMYDSGLDCLAGEEDCPVGWGWYTATYEGKRSSSDKVTVSHETIVEGSDENGKWNQRLCVQFAPLLVTTTGHISNFFGMSSRVHRGGAEPLRLTGYLFPSNWSNTDFSDDWSWNEAAKDAEDGRYYPISPSWQNIDPKTGKSIEIPVTEYLPSICETPSHVIENILVEEYDGYVWRRILGTGPMAGREARDVVVIDTLPKGMTFEAFQNECPLTEYGASWDSYKIADGRWVVKWEIPIMQVKQKGSIVYTATANFPSGAECETEDELTQNIAWILAEKNSPLSDTAEVTVTCAKVPKPIIPTTLEKLVDKEKVTKGDEVEYTINYEQTHGAIFDDALANASDWTMNGASITGGTLSISSGNKASFKYSKSKNIYVEMDAEIANDQTGEIFLRDNIHLQFKYNSSNGMTVTCLDGTKKVHEQLVSLKNNPSRWRLKLTDDVLQVWFGKDTSAGPAFTASGLTEKEGLFGFEGVAWGNFQYSKMHIHTDYAYNLVIVDNKPEEVSFVSATEGGKLEGDSIVWKFEQGMDKPIPFGTKYTVTWTGTVDDCNELVINEAYVKLLGHSDDEIRAMVSSECVNEEECEGITKVELTIDKKAVCEGDSTIIRVTTTPKPTSTSKFEYEYFLEGKSLGVLVSQDTLFVKEAGEYKVKVFDPSCATSSPMASKTVELTVNPLPTETIDEKVSICADQSFDLSKFEVDGYDVQWYKDIDTLLLLKSLEIKAEDAIDKYYYVLTNSKTGCRGVAEEFEVTINDLPGTPTVKNKELAVDAAGGKVDVSDAAVPTTNGDNVIWYDDETAADSLKSPIRVSVEKENEFVFWVSEKNSAGCESERVKVTIKITSSNKPVTRDTVLCIDESVLVTSLVKADEGYTLVWMDENGQTTEEPSKFTASQPGTTVYYVGQTDNVSVSESAEITITVVGVSSIKTEAVSYCANDVAEELTYEVLHTNCINCDNMTGVKWSFNGSDLTLTPVPETKVSSTTTTMYDVIPYYEITKDHVCMGTSQTIDVTVTFVSAPVVKGSINYTLNDAVNNKFKPLTEQNTTAVVPDDEATTLKWYDSDGNYLGEEAPVPAYKEDMTEDYTETYFVSQVVDGCESAQQKVIVNISKTPVPEVESISFCQDDDDIPAISDLVTPTLPGATLIWYNANPNTASVTPLATEPVISTTMTTDEVEEITTYYVAQTDGTVTSSAVPVEIAVFAKPSLRTMNDTTCSGPVDITKLYERSNKVTMFSTTFYAGNFAIPIPSQVGETANYSVEAFFTVPGTDKECRSDRKNIYVEIHKITDVYIDGPSTVCPESAVELTTSVTGETYDSELIYEWNVVNNSVDKSKMISDPLSETTTFELSVSDKYCPGVKAKHTVEIGNGVSEGSFVFTESNNSESPDQLNVNSATFYSCGGEVTVVANLKSTKDDFVWSDGTVGSTLKVTEGGKYTVEYTNECKTSATINIVSVPLKDNTIGDDVTLCEGQMSSLKLDIDCDETPKISWTKDGTEVSTQNTYTISRAKESDSGTYSYKVTNRGCVVERMYGMVKVYPKPEYTILPVTKICAGNSVEIGLETLTPETAMVEWASSETLVPSGQTAVVSPEKNETYTLTISQDGGCLISETIKVSVSQPVTFSASPVDTVICQGSGAVKFSLKVSSGDVNEYEWTDEDGNVVSTTSVYRASTDKVGLHTYTVKLTSEACDPVTEIVSLDVASLPLIDNVIQKAYKEAEVVAMTSTGTAPFEFAVDNGEYSADNEISVKSYGKHIFSIRDAIGCTSSKEAVFDAPDLTIPTVVTPNGDGENDIFKSEVMAEAYPNAVMKIYDRFGKKVAEVKASDGWDGSYNGVRMPSTDYWYEIWIEEIRKTYTGHFTLINP